MKQSLLFFLAIASVVTVLSCQKDDDPIPAPVYPIEGLWVGTYTIDQVPAQGALYYSLIIKPGGTLLTEGKGGDNKTYYATGTWVLDKDTLRFTYGTPDIYNNIITSKGTAVFHNTGDLTSGKWANTVNPFNTGTYPVMKRVN